MSARRIWLAWVMHHLSDACLFVMSAPGLLKVGTPKTWDQSKKDLKYIRKAGVREFISTYNRVKDLKGDELLWGDEIEYGVFKIDRDNKKIRLCLRAKDVSVTLMVSFRRFHPLTSHL